MGLTSSPSVSKITVTLKVETFKLWFQSPVTQLSQISPQPLNPRLLLAHSMRLTFIMIGVFVSFLTTPSYGKTVQKIDGNKELTIQTWKNVRDREVVKQSLDHSCGAASLATIFTHFYQIDVSEEDILERLQRADNTTSSYSFADLSDVVEDYGFEPVGLKVHLDDLLKLKVPVIVFLKIPGEADHFSVLRGLTAERVWLSDSSWGNRIISMRKFTEMWDLDQSEPTEGRILLVAPNSSEQIAQIDKGFDRAVREIQLPYTVQHPHLNNHLR
jgi:uncharacterized protein